MELFQALVLVLAAAHLQPGLGVAVPAGGEAGAGEAVVGGEIPVLEETSGEHLHQWQGFIRRCDATRHHDTCKYPLIVLLDTNLNSGQLNKPTFHDRPELVVVGMEVDVLAVLPDLPRADRAGAVLLDVPCQGPPDPLPAQRAGVEPRVLVLFHQAAVEISP